MNVKRFLKRQARKDLQALETDRDLVFLKLLKMSFYIPPNAILTLDEQQTPQGRAEALKKCRELAPPPIYFGTVPPTPQNPLPLDERTSGEIKKNFKEKTEWNK